MPEMLGKILPIGIAGLLMAGMFAAFMSTHDSYLLAWSGVIVRDVVSPIKAMLAKSSGEREADGTWGGLSSEREIYWTRAIVVILAAFPGHFRRALPASRDGLPLYVRHRHHLLRRLRRHRGFGAILEKGQYPRCVLRPDTGRAGATQLPDYE